MLNNALFHFLNKPVLIETEAGEIAGVMLGVSNRGENLAVGDLRSRQLIIVKAWRAVKSARSST
jgi:hypothetical protein